MRIALLGARGSDGRVCIKKLEARGTETISLQRNDDFPTEANALIVAASIETCVFDGPLVDCSSSISNAMISLPPTLLTTATKNLCTITSIIATTMQSVSGTGWRGVQALDQNDTTELFGGDLVVCGDQLLCPTAILAVDLVLCA